MKLRTRIAAIVATAPLAIAAPLAVSAAHAEPGGSQQPAACAQEQKQLDKAEEQIRILENGEFKYVDRALQEAPPMGKPQESQ